MFINYFDATDQLFTTLFIIIIITYAIYWITFIFKRPLVVGGVIAGMLINNLHLPPKYFNIHSCSSLGDIGIVLFMMLVGSQFDYQQLFQRKSQALISIFSILIPFSLGFYLAPYLVKLHIASQIDAKYMTLFSIFIGLALSMTAFPFLSMFLGHTNLITSRVGALALICASIDEIVFWLMLGFVLIFYQQNAEFSLYNPLDVAIYLGFMLLIGPRLIKFFIMQIKSSRTMLGFIIIGCLLSAVIADMVDLHQILGAFLFGLLLPRNNTYIIEIRRQIGDVVNIILLPIYFVKTGMGTNLHLIWDLNSIYIGLGITIIALVGKFSGAFITGSLLGFTKTEATLLGSLLNMRGVIEIILLNIGLELNIINAATYTIFIIMTIISTFLATNLSLWLQKFIPLHPPPN